MAPLNSHLKELNGWIEQLVSFQQENTALKLRLSELVDGSIFAEFLQKAELLNNELLANDESLRLLNDSAKHLEKIMLNGKTHQHPELLIQKQTQLKKDIDTYSKRFEKLKKRFKSELFSIS
ncbi:MAG: hypothetical protein J5I50_00875 [Chitinophagaceae bacterium]|nr:hypothetical protein [Chitinophagaceae bacterium]